MATVAAKDVTSPTQSNKSRGTSSETSSDSLKVEPKKTKFVVRKIPLFIKEKDIKDYLIEFDGKYDWFQFSEPSKLPNPTRRNKARFNRFYINFKEFEDAIPFIEKFRKLTIKEKTNEDKEEKEEKKEKDKKDVNKMLNKQFRENKIYKLCVEFAPNQQIPIPSTSGSSSRDRRINTIEKDADFLKFVQDIELNKKKYKEIREEAQESLIRQTVIDTYGRNKKTKKKSKLKEESEPSQPKEVIAPLAQHVASKRNRSLVVQSLVCSYFCSYYIKIAISHIFIN